MSATDSTDLARRDWRMSTAPVVLALLPLAYLLWVVVRLHVDVPFGDHWELVRSLDKLHAGTLSFRDVWDLRNEHRPLFPTLVMLGLAWITKWNTTAEVVVNLLIAITTAAVCISALRWQDQQLPKWRWWAVPILSLLLFSPAQWENFLWGQQMLVFMSVSSSAIGFRLLAAPTQPTPRFIAAIGCGIVSMYSFGSGLMYWPAGLLAFALNPALATRRRLVIWITVAVVMIGTYTIDFHRPPGSLPVLTNVANLRVIGTLVVYTFKFLGAPVAGFNGPLAALIGIGGLALSAFLVRRTFERRGTPVCVFAYVMGVNAIACGVQTAIGRAAFGTDSALASRYQTIGAQFWVSVLLLCVVAMREVQTRPRPPRLGVPVLIVTACGLSLSIAMNGAHGLEGANARSTLLRGLRPDLEAGNWKAVTPLYLNDERLIRERAEVLQRLHMSVYRETRIADPANRQPSGVIDVPTQGAIVPQVTIAGGWAVDDRGIREIRLYADGHFSHAIPLNSSRPDVAKVFPQYVHGNDILGWTTTIGFPSPGPHTFNAVAVDSDGVRTDLGTVTVNVRR